MINVYCERIGRSKKFRLNFDYNALLVERIKNINYEYRKYNSHDKSWEIRLYELFDIIKFYKGDNNIFFHFSNDDRDFFKKNITKKNEDEEDKRSRLNALVEKKEYWLKYKSQLEETYKVHEDKIHQNLKEGVKLIPFQTQAVLFADAVRNVLFALEMGTGKTLISIAYVEYNNFNKVLVLTPNSLKFNYYNEVEKFTNSKAHIINWNKNKYCIEESKYLIINYDFFRSNNSITKFKNLNISNIECLVADECHRLKNTASQTYKNYKKVINEKLFKDGKISKIFMSGTPMNNRGYELYSIMNDISNLDFPNKTMFYEDYCGMRYDPNVFGGWNYDADSTNFELLYHKISPYVFRKRKDEVLKDLPSKTYERVIFEMSGSERREYNSILFDDEIDNSMTKLLRTRQFLSNLKANNTNLIEFIENILLEGEKVVIMDYFKDSLIQLHEKYKDISVLHYGDVSIEERGDMVKKFQDKESNLKIFLSTVQTGKEGLTLTSASKIIIISQPYTVSENEQVVDRVHRISQTNKVNVYYPQYINTIDYDIFSLIEDKKKEIKKILDNEEYVTDMDVVDIDDLLNKLTK